MTKSNGTRIFKVFFLLMSLAMVCGRTGYAQTEKDFRARQSIGIAWSPLKRTDVSVGYRLSLFDNASRFQNSMFSVGGSYELFKWWKIGGQYRYYTSYEQDRHRFQIYTRWNYKLKKINLLYRLQYQQTQNYFDEEYLQYNPAAKVVRNRLQLRYSYSNKLDLYTYSEAFIQKKKGENNFYRMRYAIGGEYLYKRRHSFGLELFANDEFNQNKPDDLLNLVIGYTFHLEKKKKKGSNKKQATMPDQGS